MRNSSFFEKLTGSLRLTDEDLKSLSEVAEPAPKHQKRKIPAHSHPHDEEIVEEIVDDNFVVPEDAEVETIEEVIEDDSIDHEEIEEYYEEVIDEEEPVHHAHHSTKDTPSFHIEHLSHDTTDKEEVKESLPSTAHALPIDVFEMHHEVVLRILVSGITPENLKVSITRDRVSLSCARPAPEGIPDKNYYEREIPYGTFSRMIQLPSDVDVEHAEAVEKYGLLIIRLPKLDAKKVQELKIKSA